jgi:hypothetical protein
MRFELSSQVLITFGDHWLGDPPSPTDIVLHTCEAFAVELYLKSILALEKIPFPDKHDLDMLFKLTPQTWQDRITYAYDEVMKLPICQDTQAKLKNPPPLELLPKLTQGAKAFQKMRYIYEDKQVSLYLRPVIMALRQVIQEDHPGCGLTKVL